MTDEQFRMKADQIAVSRKTMEQKAEEMAALLKTAYDENLKMIILYLDKGDSNHHVFLNLDDEHPNTIGNRGLLCYTNRQRATEDFISPIRGWEWGYTPVRDVLNNFFNKAVIGSLIFNCYSRELTVAVPKEVLWKYFPGPYPRPEGFVDAPAEGYPEIDGKYFR